MLIFKTGKQYKFSARAHTHLFSYIHTSFDLICLQTPTQSYNICKNETENKFTYVEHIFVNYITLTTVSFFFSRYVLTEEIYMYIDSSLNLMLKQK